MIDTTVLRQLCEQATPGPLSVVNDNEGMPMEYGPLWKVVSPDPSPDDEPYFEAIIHYGVKADADLYAAAREALPQLLDENAALREKLGETEKENEVLASAVRACAEETTGYLGAIETIAAIEAKVREYCIRDEVTGVEEEFRYVTHDEDGEPIVEANTLPDAVAQLLGLSEHLHEQCAALESRLAALKEAGVAAMEAADILYNVVTANSSGDYHRMGLKLDAFSKLLRSDP